MATLVASLLGVAVFVGVFAASLMSNRGVYARYFEVRGENRELVREGVERRARFRNPLRVAGRMAGHWTSTPAADLRAVEVELTGVLEVPDGAPRVLRARSPNEVAIEIDGTDAAGRPIDPGVHALKMRWRIHDFPEAQATPREVQRGRYRESSAQLALTWSRPSSRRRPFERVRSQYIHLPKEKQRSPIVSAMAAIGLAFLLGSAAFLALRRWRVGGRRWLSALGFLFLLFVAGFLRVWSIGDVPTVSRTELGLVNASLDIYGTHQAAAVVFAQPIRPVPLKTHPRKTVAPLPWVGPAASALFGSVAVVPHSTVTPEVFRWTALCLGILCTGLVFLLGRRLGTAWPVAWLACLFHAVLPLAVLNGRLIVGEAVVAPLAVVSVLATLRWLDSSCRQTPWVPALAAGLAAVAAPIGAVFAAGLVGGVTSARGFRDAGRLLLPGSLLAVAVLFVWTLATGFPISLDLAPAAVAQSWTAPLRFLSWPVIGGDEVGRGWGLFLWFGTGIVLLVRSRRGEELPESLRLFAVPLVFVLGATLIWPDWSRAGWWLVVTPFLSVGAAQFVADQWRRPHLVGGLVFVGARRDVRFELPPSGTESGPPPLRGANAASGDRGARTWPCPVPLGAFSSTSLRAMGDPYRVSPPEWR